MLFIPPNQHFWIPALIEEYEVAKIERALTWRDWKRWAACERKTEPREWLGLREMQWICERACEVLLQAWRKYDGAWPALPRPRGEMEWESKREQMSREEMAYEQREREEMEWKRMWWFRETVVIATI